MATIEVYAKPKLLYRYRSLKNRDRELDAIENRNIFCPTFMEMNDPMEGIFDSIPRNLETHAYRAAIDNIIRQKKFDMGIASFSETWNNELMWAHYADKFHGICIAYSVPKLLLGLSPQHAFARIVYGEEPHQLEMIQRDQRDARAILSTKASKWVYEREWRLFSPGRGASTCSIQAAVAVYLGARIVPAERAIIEQRLQAMGIPAIRTRVNGYSISCPRIHPPIQA
jgi:hypothetical protein